VVNPIRKSINNRLNWHTLSLQMPVTASNNFKSYAIEFDNAYQRIKEAIIFVKLKGVKTIVLFGHSMGSRMMSAFIRENPGMVDGLIMTCCRNYGSYPLNCHSHAANLKNIKILDLYGGGNSKDINSADQRRYLISDNYSQLSI
jgi:pimeloyl-ACP methyl ester carboxylesterase